MTEPAWNTAGEQLVGRPLKSELVAGVRHFVAGQHHAETFGVLQDYHTGEERELARLTFVDVMGHACVFTCSRPRDGEWRVDWIGRAGQASAEPARPAPAYVPLSEKMLAALNSATPRLDEAAA